MKRLFQVTTATKADILTPSDIEPFVTHGVGGKASQMFGVRPGAPRSFHEGTK
jgi:hypothetical protein